MRRTQHIFQQSQCHVQCLVKTPKTVDTLKVPWDAIAAEKKKNIYIYIVGMSTSFGSKGKQGSFSMIPWNWVMQHNFASESFE